MRGKGSLEAQVTQIGVQIESWLFNCFYGHRLTLDHFFWSLDAERHINRRAEGESEKEIMGM